MVLKYKILLWFLHLADSQSHLGTWNNTHSQTPPYIVWNRLSQGGAQAVFLLATAHDYPLGSNQTAGFWRCVSDKCPRGYN